MTETFTLRADDGVEIAAYKWLPTGRARGIVQIAHGLAEHGERYARFGRALAEAGWAAKMPLGRAIPFDSSS